MITETRLKLNVSNLFRAWLAGLIDGEGNFYCRPNPNHLNPTIRVVLTEESKHVLDHIVNTIGGRLRYRKVEKSWKAHWKPQWEWEVGSKVDCLALARWLLPYLVLKKETARQFIAKIEASLQ